VIFMLFAIVTQKRSFICMYCLSLIFRLLDVSDEHNMEFFSKFLVFTSPFSIKFIECIVKNAERNEELF
jgi:hypothetical protein